MADYRIVKYCRNCNKRFLVGKGESRTYYCEDCYKEIEKRKNALKKEQEVLSNSDEDDKSKEDSISDAKKLRKLMKKNS